MELHTFYLTVLYTLLSPLLSDSPIDPGVEDAQFNLAMLRHPDFEQMRRDGEDDVVNGRPQRQFRAGRYSHVHCDHDMKPARSMTCPSGSWHTLPSR
jgi:hypothetical protein